MNLTHFLAQAPTDMSWIGIIAAIVVIVLIAIPIIMGAILRTVESGAIRLVSGFGGNVKVFKGPGKSRELPLFTTGTTIPSKAINIDLDIADQTADVDKTGQPRPIKVRVLASAIVSVGDSDIMIKTAANRFFAKPPDEQTNTLTDLLTSTGRRAINLLHHDELFNAKAPFMGDSGDGTTRPAMTGLAAPDDEDRLAIIIKSACSRELQDLGLVFNSLNIKSVQSDVAEARRRQSAVEAKANADIVQADQERRAREAQLTAEQAVNDKQRELDQRKAQNAALIAEAEAKKQDALRSLREAELQATQIAQASADAQRIKIQAEAAADAEAIRLRTTSAAQADAIREVNQAISEGGNAYLTLRQLELLPQIAPTIAGALAQAKLVNISSDPNHGAAESATNQISSVIQTVLAAQLVSGTLKDAVSSEPAPPPSLPAQTATAQQPAAQQAQPQAQPRVPVAPPKLPSNATQ